MCYELTKEDVRLKAPGCAGVHWETDNFVLSALHWEAHGLWWTKREPENKANPSSRLTWASAHIHSHTGEPLDTRGGPLKSYDSGELLSLRQRKHPPLLGPLTQVTLRGLFQVSHSSWFLWSNYLRHFQREKKTPATPFLNKKKKNPEFYSQTLVFDHSQDIIYSG